MFSKRGAFQKRPFVHNSVCSQFLEGLFAILAECSQFGLRSFESKIKRKSITSLVGREGGVRGTKIVKKKICEQTGISYSSRKRRHSVIEDFGKEFYKKGNSLKRFEFWCANPWAFSAKYSAEKTKYIDVSQPPHLGDELNRR